jgi:hypothetical protein
MATKVPEESQPGVDSFFTLLKKTFGKGTNKVELVRGETSKTQKIRISSKDRAEVHAEMPAFLKKHKYKFKESYEGSAGSYDITLDTKYTIRILFKPISGGMTETTLNSTITELVPALLFAYGEAFTDAKECYDWMNGLKSYKNVVLPEDTKAAKEFLLKAIDSSKFEEKMGNAFGVLKYLNDLHDKTAIKQVIWGYRKKPTGVAPNHKGDLFVEFTTGNLLGVSLKAGGAKTEEPKLNTYVNPFLENIKASRERDKLKDRIYESIHKEMGLPKNWQPTKDAQTIREFRERTKQTYLDKHYDNMLEMCRSTLIDVVNESVANTIHFIKEQILAEQEDVPLVVVKAYGTSYQMLTEEDDLAAFIPKTKSVSAYPSKTSKQNWHIKLSGTKETLILNMSIRTNKSAPHNKLSQGFNLAVKFNSLS